jgi:hypothetical protein
MGYNQRNLTVTGLPDGREQLTGVFRDDSRPVGASPRPDRPFQITLPIGFDDWVFLNQRVFYALHNDSGPVVIDVDWHR